LRVSKLQNNKGNSKRIAVNKMIRVTPLIHEEIHIIAIAIAHKKRYQWQVTAVNTLAKRA